ncbi:MAG: glycosyltransferase family 39 protein [Anaerolineae bacterium]|nr:glycosyltransferase family 39 protein [Anaerolineae bacterium]
MRRLWPAILAVYLVLAVGYALVQPLGEAPDEADHYAYARYLALERALPVGPTVTQGKHPPLYHGLVALLAGWTGMDFDFLRSNPDAFPPGPDKPPNFFVHTTLEDFPWRDGALAMRIGRFLSVVLGAVTLWATWRLAGEVFPEQPAVAALAAGFLAGLPGFLYIAGAMNNDNAAGALGGLALFLMVGSVRQGFGPGRAAVLGVVFGLGLLAKVGTLALWPLAALAVVGEAWARGAGFRAWRRWAPRAAAHLALAWGLGLLIAAPWLLRNHLLYGDPFGWALVRATVDQRTAPLGPADLVWLARGVFGYFWGRFGAIGQVRLPAWAYRAALGFSLFVLVGIVLALRRRPPTDRGQAVGLLMVGLAPVLSWVGLVQYSTIALGTDQARLLWPAVAAIAVGFGLGLWGWLDGLPSPLRRAAVPGVIGLMALYGLSALTLVLWPAFAPPPSPDFPAVAELQPQIVFGGRLQLMRTELPETPLTVGEPLPLRLTWQALTPLDEDLRVVVRLVHQDGWLAAEWDHSPALGRYPTDRWRPGEPVADPYWLTPNPPAAGTFTVLVGVRPFRGDWLPVEPAGETAPFAIVGRVGYR